MSVANVVIRVHGAPKLTSREFSAALISHEISLGRILLAVRAKAVWVLGPGLLAARLSGSLAERPLAFLDPPIV